MFNLKSCLITLLAFSFSLPLLAQESEKAYKVAIIDGDFIAQNHFDTIELELGMKFEFQTYRSFLDVTRALTLKNADFAANVVYTPERETFFQVSSPTNIMPAYFFSQSFKFADAKKIATPKNSIIVKLLGQYYPDIEILEYVDEQKAIEWTKSGKVDGVIDTVSTLEKFLSKGLAAEYINNQLPIAPVGLAASLSIDNKLLEEMASVLQTSDVQKRMRTSIDKYQLKFRKLALQKQAEGLNVDLSQPIIVKFDNLPSFAAHSADGDVKGIAADLVHEICNVLEASCMIRSTGKEEWSSLYQELIDGKIDVLSPTGISAERTKQVYFSEPFYTSNAVVVKRYGYNDGVYSDFSELIAENVGVIENEYFERVINQLLPNKLIIKYKSLDDEIQGLINGEVDYILLNEIEFNNVIKASENSLPIQIDPFFTNKIDAEIGFAFSKTERGQLLSKLFNSALTIINTKAIVAKYDAAPDWLYVMRNQQRNKQISYSFLFCLIAVILFFLFILYRRSVVDELTHLKNRRALYSKYGRRGIKAGSSVIYLDINKFKRLNDTYGHAVGDKALTTLAHKIKQYWNADSYRLGGDEFVLIGKVTEQDKINLVTHISQFDIYNDGQDLDITASIGLYYAEEDTTIIDAKHHADKAMYENKKKMYSADASKTHDERVNDE